MSGVTRNDGLASQARRFFIRSLLKGTCLLVSVLMVVTASVLLAGAPIASAAAGGTALHPTESQNGGNASHQPLTGAAAPAYHEIAPAANVYLKHVNAHGATTQFPTANPVVATTMQQYARTAKSIRTTAASGCAWHSYQVIDGGSIIEWLGADFCWNGQTAMAYNVQASCNALIGSICQYHQYGITQQYTSAVYVWADFHNTYSWIGSGGEELRIQVDRSGNESTYNWDI
jgi:hypothetical protein